MCSRTDNTETPEDHGETQSPRFTRRNHRLAVLNGIFGQIAIVFVHPELVLVGMIYALAGDAVEKRTLLYLAAVVTVVSKAGMLGPQLIVGSFLEHRRDKKPMYVMLLIIRAIAYCVMIGSVYLVGCDYVSMALGLGLFFAAYLVVCVCAGSSHVIYTDIIARIIPIGRMGRFIGLRNFLGLGLGMAAGFFVIQGTLTHVRLPHNYAVLITTGGFFAILAMAVFVKTRAPDGPRAKERTSLLQSLRRGFDWLKVDHNYRCYLWLRVAFRTNYLGLAFFIPYGIEHMCRSGDVTEVAALTGVMVATEKGSRWLTALLWGMVTDRRGFRTCLVGGGIGFMLMPVLALAAPHVPTLFEVGIPFTDAVLTLPLCVYLLALAAWGAAMQGSIIGGNRFYIGSAPPHRRISYMGFQNTVTSPLTLLPLAGAALAVRFGVGIIFWVVAAGSILYLVSALRMIPEHKAVAGRDEVVIDNFHVGGS